MVCKHIFGPDVLRPQAPIAFRANPAIMADNRHILTHGRSNLRELRASRSEGTRANERRGMGADAATSGARERCASGCLKNGPRGTDDPLREVRWTRDIRSF